MKNKDYQAWAITKEPSPDDYGTVVTQIADPEPFDNMRLIHAVLGISGEAGELTDAIKKSVMYGKELNIIHVKEEAGDILWYMSVLLDTIGSSFEEVMQMNHDKLEKRYPSKFSKEDAIARADKS